MSQWESLKRELIEVYVRIHIIKAQLRVLQDQANHLEERLMAMGKENDKPVDKV